MNQCPRCKVMDELHGTPVHWVRQTWKGREDMLGLVCQVCSRELKQPDFKATYSPYVMGTYAPPTRKDPIFRRTSESMYEEFAARKANLPKKG